MPLRRDLSRRAGLSAVGLACIALCAGCGELHARLTTGPPRPLTVAIDGTPNALYAPLVSAQSNGDFAAGALSVSLISAATGNAVSELESGAADVAIISEPALLTARDHGAHLVAIGALLSAPLDGVVSLAAQPVANARALRGQTVATDGTPLAAAELSSLLSAGGVHSASVRRIVAPNLDGVLRSRRARATLGGPWPLERVQLARAGVRTSVLPLPQAGVPTYSGLVVAVRVNEAHFKGPLLRAFLQSLGRGAQAVAAQPAATARALAKRYPQLSESVERALLTAVAPLAASATASKPFGFENAAAWLAFSAWMQVHGLLSPAADGAAAFTNEFLPGQGA